MVVAFRYWADFGHFSHPATIYSSLTYPIPPKTSIMGALAAIGGLESLEEYLFLNAIRYSVVVENISGKQSFCFNGIKNALPSVKANQAVQIVKSRKQFLRELLVNPRYLIIVDFGELANDERVQVIIRNLQEHIALFPVYMGTNLCLADFEWVECAGEYISNDQMMPVHSFLPLPADFEIEPNRSYTDVRIPTTIDKGRIFGGFTDLIIETSGKGIKAKPQQIYKTPEHNLLMI